MLVLFLLFALLPGAAPLQHSDCLQECDKLFDHDMIHEFEQCMKNCSAKKINNGRPPAAGPPQFEI